ncbi:MAG: DUF4974 domain-containing protein [Bacteroidales bacterium]
MVKHILAFCLLLNFALAYGQNDLLNHKVTLHVKNATLDSVLEMITQQTGVNFSYSNQSIQSERTIAIIAEDKTLTEVLNEISKNLHLQFKVVKDQVVIKAAKENRPKRKSSPSAAMSGMQKPRIAARSNHLGPNITIRDHQQQLWLLFAHIAPRFVRFTI